MFKNFQIFFICKILIFSNLEKICKIVIIIIWRNEKIVIPSFQRNRKTKGSLTYLINIIAFLYSLTAKTYKDMTELYFVMVVTKRQTRTKHFGSFNDADEYFKNRMAYYQKPQNEPRLNWIELFDIMNQQKIKEFDPLLEEIKAIQDRINAETL